jgi:hypothetical protein
MTAGSGLIYWIGKDCINHPGDPAQSVIGGLLDAFGHFTVRTHRFRAASAPGLGEKKQHDTTFGLRLRHMSIRRRHLPPAFLFTLSTTFITHIPRHEEGDGCLGYETQPQSGKPILRYYCRPEPSIKR